MLYCILLHCVISCYIMLNASRTAHRFVRRQWLVSAQVAWRKTSVRSGSEILGSPYQDYPRKDCLTQNFREIPYVPGTSTLLNEGSAWVKPSEIQNLSGEIGHTSERAQLTKASGWPPLHDPLRRWLRPYPISLLLRLYLLRHSLHVSDILYRFSESPTP